MIGEIVNGGISAVPPTKGEDLPTRSQLKDLKIVKKLPSVFHSVIPMNTHTKEGIVERYDSCDEFGLLGDEVTLKQTKLIQQKNRVMMAWRILQCRCSSVSPPPPPPATLAYMAAAFLKVRKFPPMICNIN